MAKRTTKKKATTPKTKKTKEIKEDSPEKAKTVGSKRRAAKKDKSPSVEEKASKRSTRNKPKLDYSAENLNSNIESSFGGKIIPMLASKYDGSTDVLGWYMSEKLDGVRCIWDGKKLYSRNGNNFFPPDYFIEKFPKDATLDGELFLDRYMFTETIRIVKKQYANDGWKEIKYIVYDAPLVGGSFSKRLTYLKKVFETNESEYLKLHEQEKIDSLVQLDARMKEITTINGEGLILKDPNSIYENRRTKTMLKVKEFHDDEAEVLSHHKGTGRLENTLGAIEVKNKNGVIFRIGSGFTDKERSKPPKIGSTVTYRYFELSKDGVPRFPTYMREFTNL